MPNPRLYDLLQEFLPDDHSRQSSAFDLVPQLISTDSSLTVLDLGCGSGASRQQFLNLNKDIFWVGLDIRDSPEVRDRKSSKHEGSYCCFDGKTIPFRADSFDLIFCTQVLEHVRYPERLIAEVNRVLKPGGSFVGSLSYLEPFHSFSYWNMTPFCFAAVVREANLSLVELRPCIDVLTLIMRQLLLRPKFFDRWAIRESPLNKVISIYGKIARKSTKEVNALKLQFCSFFCFAAIKKC
ncbi:class I SAM-dependent methyltransferase [Oligoflexia bacterium]|nr:class I SAM-dependent methyltransferase [Oligoflexia bacterium]